MTRKLLSIIAFILFTNLVTTAQDFTIPASPTNKEEFIKSEPDIIAAAKWLEANPIGTQKEKTIQVNAYVVKWITDSPTVTIELSADFIVKLFEKNEQLMIVFMAGYTKYSLENNYSKDKLKCYTAGIKSALNNYALGGDVKKNKLLSKAIEADKEGKLEEWVSEKMNSK